VRVDRAAGLAEVAREEGRDAGRLAAATSGETAVVDALSEVGFEPHEDSGAITLANCPFHALAMEDTERVCGMNLAYVAGLLEGAGATGQRATLVPDEAGCCVRIDCDT
jgi:predicted ArsR family transcriptional regulator